MDYGCECVCVIVALNNFFSFVFALYNVRHELSIFFLSLFFSVYVLEFDGGCVVFIPAQHLTLACYCFGL